MTPCCLPELKKKENLLRLYTSLFSFFKKNIFIILFFSKNKNGQKPSNFGKSVEVVHADPGHRLPGEPEAVPGGGLTSSELPDPGCA